jgi:hypothetical protein
MNKGKVCLIQNCGKPAFCKQMCSKHYQQVKFNGKIKEKNHIILGDFCKNLSCGQPVFAKGLCQNHYVKQRLVKVSTNG